MFDLKEIVSGLLIFFFISSCSEESACICEYTYESSGKLYQGSEQFDKKRFEDCNELIVRVSPELRAEDKEVVRCSNW